jgi:hypothetical protein
MGAIPILVAERLIYHLTRNKNWRIVCRERRDLYDSEQQNIRSSMLI